MFDELIAIFVFTFLMQVFWIVQLIDLMSRKDSEFPGRFDKPAWGIVLAITNVLGALAFFLFKHTRSVPASQEPPLSAPPEIEPAECLECGSPIPGDRSQCPVCGWSYE